MREEAMECKTGTDTGIKAFTLIELLVVIAVIALLISILIPGLAKAEELARRTTCSSNIRQFIFGCHLYANEHDDFLPGGHSDDRSVQNEVTILLAENIRNELVELIGDEQMLQCPSLKRPFTDPGGWFIPDNGYLIGYNYLGGHRETPWGPVAGDGINPDDYEQWVSPQKSSAKNSPALVTELNTWSTYEFNLYTFVPHGSRAAITEDGDSRNSGAGGISSDELGAIGGNRGTLDGSVTWKQIRDMKVRRATYPFTSCYAMW